MPDSYQEKLKRVRPPRVKIEASVYKGDAMEIPELPFVVGVMADLSGQPAEGARKAYKERRFVPIDRDNFNDVLARSAPRVAFRVADQISGQPDQMLNVELNFKSMADFSPAEIAKQIPVLRELLETRKKFEYLLSKTEGKDNLVALLEQVLANTENRDAIAKLLEQENPPAEESKADSDKEASE